MYESDAEKHVFAYLRIQHFSSTLHRNNKIGKRRTSIVVVFVASTISTSLDSSAAADMTLIILLL